MDFNELFIARSVYKLLLFIIVLFVFVKIYEFNFIKYS